MNNSRSGGSVDPSEYVADAWFAFLRNPDQGFDLLRDEIEAMLYRLLSPRTLVGFFDLFFEGIVQEAMKLTLSRFLAGNEKLVWVA